MKLGYAREGKTYDATMKADAISRMMVFNRSGGDGPMRMRGPGAGHMMMLPPEVEMDIERMGPKRECAPGNKDCHFPAMVQAFRWQGLNLSSIDTSLGRYFGTDKGVLVVSSDDDLKGLQSGDVIQRVAGKDGRDAARRDARLVRQEGRRAAQGRRAARSQGIFGDPDRAEGPRPAVHDAAAGTAGTARRAAHADVAPPAPPAPPAAAAAAEGRRPELGRWQ